MAKLTKEQVIDKFNAWLLEHPELTNPTTIKDYGRSWAMDAETGEIRETTKKLTSCVLHRMLEQEVPR